MKIWNSKMETNEKEKIGVSQNPTLIYSEKKSRTIGKLAMFFSGCLMGFVGLFVTYFFNRSIYTVVVFRGFFGLLWLLFFIFVFGMKKTIFPLLRSYPISIMMQAFFSAFTVYFYFTAIKSLNYAFAAFLLYLGPVFAVIFNLFFLKIKIPMRTYISFPISLLGLALLLNLEDNFVPGEAFFNGVLSALCLAISTTFKCFVFEDIQRKKNFELIHVQTIMPFFVCLFLVAVFIFQSDITGIPLSIIDLLLGSLLGLFPTALAFTLYNIGLNQDKGGDVIILSYSEPLVTSVLSILIQHVVDPLLYIGGSLIVLANLIILLEKRKEPN